MYDLDLNLFLKPFVVCDVNETINPEVINLI